MKILTGMFSHETNTFSNLPTSLEKFSARTISYGDDLPIRYEGTETPLGGFITIAREEGAELICTVAATASPAGRVSRDAFEHVVSHLLKGCEKQPDGVLLSLHGAMVAEGIEDGEGELLRRIRQQVGPEIPIMATLDFHANVSEAMVNHSTALVGYKTYPHIDIHACALKAAKLMAATVRKEIRPVAAFRHLPLLTPVMAQGTDREPMKHILALAMAMETQPGVLSVSILPGFPYADVPDAGFSVLVVTDGDSDLANTCTQRLADQIWSLRSRFTHQAIPVEQAVAEAMDAREYPVLLADVSDNTGGGGAGDGTAILAELLARGAKDTAISTLWDAAAVEASIRAGVGRDVRLWLGGKTDRNHGDPLDVVARVVRITDGNYLHKGPLFRGTVGNMGRAVLLNVQGILIVVHELRVQSFEPEILRSMGVEPTEQKILVIKSSIHYRAAFEPLVRKIIEVDAPGLVSPHLSRFDFQHIRRPIFPFDPI